MPQGAFFLERHPGVGRSNGKLNAHGNPLPPHIAGVCHELGPGSLSELHEALDTYAPTRIALSFASIFESSGPGVLPAPPSSEGHLSDEWDTVIQGTDIVYASASEGAGVFNKQGCSPSKDLAQIWFWNQVWRAQKLEGAVETYFTCREGLCADVQAEVGVEEMAISVRGSFSRWSRYSC